MMFRCYRSRERRDNERQLRTCVYVTAFSPLLCSVEQNITRRTGPKLIHDVGLFREA